MSAADGTTLRAQSWTDAAPDAAAWRALLASTLGYAMDGFDLLILGFMLGAIKADLGLTDAQGASLATFTLVGAVAASCSGCWPTGLGAFGSWPGPSSSSRCSPASARWPKGIGTCFSIAPSRASA